MKPESTRGSRCGLDTVPVARIETLIRGRTDSELLDHFSAGELADAGTGPGRAASLAARFAAKEACAKLFPRETALGILQPSDFFVIRDPYGAPQVGVTPRGQAVLDRHRIASLRISLTHTPKEATAIVTSELRRSVVPWYGRLLYRLFPYRRGVVMDNLRRVFGEVLPEDELRDLAQAYYGHYVLFLWEMLRQPFLSARRRERSIRVENIESPLHAHAQGKGVFLLTGHFGNFEVATVAGIQRFPEYRGKFYFVRRLLKPALLNAFVTWRFRRAGFTTLGKRGSLDAIYEALQENAFIVFVFDQHAGPPDGVVVDFFGHPAGTFKSLAILALDTGAPVVPVSSWREPDGSHVIRFEDPLPVIECDSVGEAIRKNTRAYNEVVERMLLRHPEQWIWMHKRWKASSRKPASNPVPNSSAS